MNCVETQLATLADEVFSARNEGDVLVVVNKADCLAALAGGEEAALSRRAAVESAIRAAAKIHGVDPQVLFLSAREGEGMSALCDRLVSTAAAAQETESDVVVTNARHYAALTAVSTMCAVCAAVCNREFPVTLWRKISASASTIWPKSPAAKSQPMRCSARYSRTSAWGSEHRQKELIECSGSEDISPFLQKIFLQTIDENLVFGHRYGLPRYFSFGKCPHHDRKRNGVYL